MPADDPTAPVVLLGDLHDDSVAAAIYAMVSYGVARRPELATQIRGAIVLRFHEGYPGVRIEFRGEEIEVTDDLDGEDRAVDLLISGRMGDVNALIASPLTGGLPRPTHPRGRAALGRLADGRVEFDGPLLLGRKLIMLLTLEEALPTRAATRARSRQRSAAAPDPPAPAGS
jgi:hypothetical protein